MAILGIGLSGSKNKKPIGGVWWWIVFGICALADIFDFVLSVFEFAALATVIGAKISIVIGLIDSVIAGIVGSICTAYYLLVRARMTRTLLTIALGAIIDQIPIIELIPSFTLIFVLTRLIENRFRANGGSSLGGLFAYAR